MTLRTRRGSHGSYSHMESNDTVVSRLVRQDRVPWYRKPNLRLLYFMMFPTCLAVEMTSGFDSSMLNGLQAVPSWLEYYGHPHSAVLGLVSAIYSLGSIVALPFVPSVVDSLGRRHSIFVGSILMTIGGILQGAALNITMFIMARFVLGLGIVFAIVAASSLIGELSHPKERAVMGSLFNTCYWIGSIAAAAVTLETFAMTSNWAWRIPSFLQVVPSLLQMSFIWFLPESPRWLISKGREEEAYGILVTYHAEGDEDSDFVQAEYAQIEQTLRAELEASKMGWKEALSSTGIRKRVIVGSFLGLFAQWSGNGPISYFLAPILDNIGVHDNRTKNIINFAKNIWSLVNCTFFALTVPRFPRRTVYLTCTITLLIIFIAWTAANAEFTLTHSIISSQIVLVLIFLYSPAYNMGFNVLTYTFLVELFPFHIRAKGITLFQWWSRLAKFVTQFVDPIGIEAAGWKYYIVYCVWIAFEVAFVYFLFPETSGKTLEELTFLYEDERMQQDHTAAEVETLLHRHGETETENTEGIVRRTPFIPGLNDLATSFVNLTLDATAVCFSPM